MEQFLIKGIKEIINEFPAIGKLLEEYEIGCTTCQLGSCQLKDIVSIHNLTADREKELFTRMSEILFPGKPVSLPAPSAKAKPAAQAGTYSPPLRKMVDEHTFIKKVLAAIPDKVGAIDIAHPDGKAAVEHILDFIRKYADKYHHAKEEDLLFKYFDQNSEVLQVMYADHVNGRNHVREAAAALERGDKTAMLKSFTMYKALLTEHISKEDDILYPWMDRELSINQIGELFAACAKVDEEYKDASAAFENFASAL